MRIRIALVAAALLVTLTGCSAPTDTAPTDDPAPTQAAVEETAAPLEADRTASVSEDAEGDFLVEVRDRLSKIQSQIPNATDEQLVSAGQDACDRLAGGEAGENMTLIEGEELTNGYFMDSGAIIIAARLTLCPIG